jgi:hypothetical protein
MMRLLVCGDRNWSSVESILTQIRSYQPSVVIEGEAKGADTIAREVANHLGIPVLSFPADWKKYGRAAGPIRNAQMLKEGRPDFVLAFHDNIETSKGTKNMVMLAKKAGIPTRVVTS